MRTLEVYISGIDVTSTTYATINEALEALRALHNAGKHPTMHIITTHIERGNRFKGIKGTFVTSSRSYFYNRLNQLDTLEARSYNGNSGKAYSSYWHRDKLARILGV